MKTYILEQEGREKVGRIVVSENSNRRELELEPSLRVRRHSPTGFAWGYTGSGPAQSALAILLDYTGDQAATEELYHRFKFEKIATMPAEGGKITGAEIDTWLYETKVQDAAARHAEAEEEKEFRRGL